MILVLLISLIIDLFVVIYGYFYKKILLSTGKYVVDNLIIIIVSNYDRNIVYRLGFKKAQDSHWYLVSSEPVK